MKLIVFSGLPGTGKSTPAEVIGKELGIPVFAKDWPEATLLRSGLKPVTEDKSLGSAGYELLSVLAEHQLILGQSVILDTVAGSQTILSKWHQLARQYSADRKVTECICLDESLHCSKLKDRKRNIQGWHELEWAEVERIKN